MNRVVGPARLAGGIDSLESNPVLLSKSLYIRAFYRVVIISIDETLTGEETERQQIFINSER
jgi:hypothetical protein